MVGKIDYHDFLEDHFELARRPVKQSWQLALYYDKNKLNKILKRFENEIMENQELNE